MKKVPAGISAMDALARVAKVRTRYGGRYVQSIDGLAGSLSRQRDWFYFVNGYEADRSAADYKLHDGDVEWWDYRSWQTKMEQPVVVGAFPEPFVHGFNGKRRPAVVAYDSGSYRQARAVAKRVHARLVRIGTRVPAGANLLVVKCPSHPGHPHVAAGLRSGGSAGAPVTFVANCEPDFAQRVRYHYELQS